MSRVLPYQARVPVDNGFIEQTWQRLRDAIVQIQRHNESTLSFEELYRCAYNLILHKRGARLYAGLQELLTAEADRIAESVMSTMHGPEFLNGLLQAWREHVLVMQMIRDVLLYVDHNYVPRERLQPVYDLGLAHFRDQVVLAGPLRARLRAVLLDAVRRDREAEPVDRRAIHDACGMLLALGLGSPTVYEEVFESELLAASAAFFAGEGTRLMAERSAAVFLQASQRLLAAERARVDDCLAPTTRPRITELFITHLLAPHLVEAMELDPGGLPALFDALDHDGLRRLFLLCGELRGGRDKMRDLLGAHVLRAGRAIVAEERDAENPLHFVVRLLDLKLQCEQVSAACFDDDRDTRDALARALRTALNEHPRAPDCIAAFIDDFFKRSSKKMSDSAIDDVVQRIIGLFRMLADKDVFELQYRQHLARRLLARTSAEDPERALLARLKEECGSQFTARAEGMFADCHLGRDYADQFALFAQSNKIALPVPVTFSILTKSQWPTPPPFMCTLPQTLRDACAAFERFYATRHKGRTLAWHCGLGSADVHAWFAASGKRHVLQLTTTQLSVLMLFDAPAAPELDFKTVLSATGLSEADARRAVLSLCAPKTRVLLRRGGRDLDPTDTITVNDAFSHALVRVKIAQIAVRDNQANTAAAAAAAAKVAEDRNFQIDAMVVRIMKARKTLPHAALVAEACEQLKSRFVPNPAAIKRRIDNLIERDYLSRGDDRSLIKYNA
eukprot:m.238808 g.238808  ORF g.238808 m.238808 type:complete len:733 (+) comp22043_c0_seq1:42-2240(+)